MTAAPGRYDRQERVPGVGAAGQEKLKNASVLLVGAGGLGCPALLYLAGAGVGRLTVVDGDVVSLNNLHRQILFREDEIGQPKARLAAAAAHRLNSEITVTAVEERLSIRNGAALIRDHDLVIDAADLFEVTFLLSELCRDAGKPLVSASVLGMTGYVGVFCAGAPDYRAVFPEPPAGAATCASAGVLGPAAGLLGCLQAQEALKLILGVGQPLLGRLLTVDLASHKYGGFDFSKAPPAPPLGFQPELRVEELTAADHLYDLRGPDEIAAQAIPGAQAVAADILARDAAALPAAGRIVLCCASGQRAQRAARLLTAKGVDAGRVFVYPLAP